MKLSVRDLDLPGRRVFIRVDFNVPFENGVVSDDTRIRASLPTIRYVLDQGATAILASHLGRPKGQVNPKDSLKPVAATVAELLGRPVTFAEDCIGEPARSAVARAHAPGGGGAGAARGSGAPQAEAPVRGEGAPGSKLVLLENLRFHPEEEKNDPQFAKQLASLADLYVNDAFGAAHRAHASVDAITRLVPRAAAGLLMEKELEYLGRVLTSPDRPLVAILGGAKVSDKLEVIQNFLGRVDRLIVGGAMAYTFLKSRGVAVGRSLVEDDKLDVARDIEANAKARGLQLGLPVDHVVADTLEAGVPSETLDVVDPAIGNRMGLDIGPKTIDLYAGMIKDAKTVVWNGPMGVFEIPDFAKGTNAVARAVAEVRGTTIVGGGDSIAAIHQAGIAGRITHISTGGGASLEFLGGRKLPGVEALTDK
jgi:phosphoglycerate kinase